MGLSGDELMEIEGDVGAAMDLAGLEDDSPPTLELVCVALTGAGPQLAPMRGEGRVTTLGGVHRVEMRMGVLGTPRGRQVLGHELGHVYGAKVLRRDVSEAWCDAFGAALSAPRRATLRALRHVGESPASLATLLQIEEAAALLRIGEVVGRPVLLERRPGVLKHRGDDYGWPPRRDWFAVDRSRVHPVRVDARWGLMAR